MPDNLSEREKQVAAHLAAGLRVTGVASELCIAEITVRNHLRNIFAKLDLHSQSDLIAKIRREPELVGAYRRLAAAGELEKRPLLEELEAADRATAARLDELFAAQSRSTSHPQTLKAVLRAVLPLDEERRREWRTRLAVQAMADDRRELRHAFGVQRRQWLVRQVRRISSLQDLGWVRKDLEPDELRRRLFAAVYAAALAMLADPSADERERQLASLDGLIDSLSAD